MALYRKVLCAVDLTEKCHLLVQRAIALSADPAAIAVVHVAEHPISGYGEQPGEYHVVTETQIRQQLFPRLKQLLDQQGLKPDQARIEFGDPVQDLLQVQQSGNYDLIVVGGHPHGKWRALFGTTRDNLLHEVQCDLLAVCLEGEQ
ncbi:universal stress protein [Pseudomaricurvus sp. HS19]|nr:universal stress protein [Pseudomaricurvus sp. HS19]MYM62311.1 universal stress protein [Pseudomaricurvus sp. HS19]